MSANKNHSLDSVDVDKELFVAFENKDIEKITTILNSKNFNIEAKNEYGETSLHVAAKYGNYDIVLKLLNLGANIESKDNNGYTPLHKSVRSDGSIINLLLNNGAYIEAKGHNNLTPLLLTIYWNNPLNLEILLGRGANINNIKSNIWYMIQTTRPSEEISEILRAYRINLTYKPINNEKFNETFLVKK